jgi:hypothetical protein
MSSSFILNEYDIFVVYLVSFNDQINLYDIYLIDNINLIVIYQ